MLEMTGWLGLGWSGVSHRRQPTNRAQEALQRHEAYATAVQEWAAEIPKVKPFQGPPLTNYTPRTVEAWLKGEAGVSFSEAASVQAVFDWIREYGKLPDCRE